MLRFVILKLPIFALALMLLTSIGVADKILELKFDEGEGDTVSDTSGAGNDGTIVGAQWTEGKFGSALEFDGAGTHVTIPDSQSLQITDEMTVAAWVYFSSLGASGNHDAIVAKANTWSFITFKRSAPAYQFAWWDSIAKNIMPGEAKWLASEWVPEVETWYHLAVTMKSEDKLIFYRDGEAIKESEYPATIPPGAGQAVQVGKGNGATENFAGVIDEVAILNSALSGNEIQKLMNMSSPVEPMSKLEAVWGGIKKLN